MQSKGSRMYRVKAVAQMLDVSPATIYRAIESGQLKALKLGTGAGTLRIPEAALEAYMEACGQAAIESAADELGEVA
jgi:excisionase family DNA binding protein